MTVIHERDQNPKPGNQAAMPIKIFVKNSNGLISSRVLFLERGHFGSLKSAANTACSKAKKKNKNMVVA